jgi:hypothetical protein
MSANKPSSVAKSSKGQHVHIQTNTKDQKKLDKRMLEPQNIAEADALHQWNRSKKNEPGQWGFPVAVYHRSFCITR